MKVSIVIINFNGLKNTLACIDSLRNPKIPQQTEIIIVDNNSQDQSKATLAKVNDIVFISLDENKGFSGGNNFGIKEAFRRNSDAVVLLNNDTLVDEDFLGPLILTLKKADIISPKIYFAKGYEYHKKYRKNQLGKVIWFAGGKIDWANILGYHLGVDEVDKGQYESQKEIDFATGAAMIIKRDVFDKIGLLDEKYFLYLEDLDFCVRAKKRGFKIYYEPKSIIWHKNAGSSYSGSSLQDYYISRNRLLFAFKYAPLKTKFAVLRQAARELKNPIKRKALIDFLTFNLGKGSYLK